MRKFQLTTVVLRYEMAKKPAVTEVSGIGATSSVSTTFKLITTKNITETAVINIVLQRIVCVQEIMT